MSVRILKIKATNSNNITFIFYKWILFLTIFGVLIFSGFLSNTNDFMRF